MPLNTGTKCYWGVYNSGNSGDSSNSGIVINWFQSCSFKNYKLKCLFKNKSGSVNSSKCGSVQYKNYFKADTTTLKRKRNEKSPNLILNFTIF